MAPKEYSHGLPIMAVYGEKASTTIKSTSTTSNPVYTGSLIWPLGTTILPSKLTRGELYVDKSSGFKPSPLKRSGYIISVALPWSIMTLLTSYPPILRVTTRASSCGCMVPYLSTSEKLSTRGTFVLTLFGTELSSSSR